MSDDLREQIARACAEPYVDDWELVDPSVKESWFEEADRVLDVLRALPMNGLQLPSHYERGARVVWIEPDDLGDMRGFPGVRVGEPER